MTEENPGKHVAVIGLGNMGSALASALLAGGHDVIVWNRSASKGEPLMSAGAAVAGSAAEAAAAANVVIVCVIDHQSSLSVLQTEEMAVALCGRLLVQFSTVTAEESRELGRWAEGNGIAYLDGAILGYPENIREQACTIVYSGPKSDFEANKDVLAALGGNPQHVGEAVGGAAIFDKTIYAYHYGSMLAFFHGAALCHAAGFPIQLYVERVVARGTRQETRCAEMIATRSYDNSSAALEVDAAAYAHVVRLSDALGIDRDFPRTVARYLARAIEDGYGKEDLAAVFEVLVKQNARSRY